MEHCPQCLSIDIQTQMWVKVNTNEMLDNTENYSWCPDCDEDGGEGAFECSGKLTEEILESASRHCDDVKGTLLLAELLELHRDKDENQKP